MAGQHSSLNKRPMVAGNWKMHGRRGDLSMIDQLTQRLQNRPARCDVIVCPPAVYLAEAVATADDGPVGIGAQTCRGESDGAFTGDLAASMVADVGASYVIVGHSERRAGHGETDADVASQAQAALAARLTAIICIGEQEQQRRAGAHLSVVEQQLRASVPAEATINNTIIAYEPVWAIGTGLAAQVSDIAQMHGHLAAIAEQLGLADVRLLYGGSVKPENAAAIAAQPNVDGALVGGASLTLESFDGIIDVYR